MAITPTVSSGRVMIAPSDSMWTWSPTWKAVDYYDNLVAGYDLSRGRQTELDTTETSTAIVYLNDTEGYFDPNNVGSPFYVANGLEGRQIMLQAWNPVTEEWVQQTRMWIDEVRFDFHPSGLVTNVQLHCVDIFDYLANIEMDLTRSSGNRVFGDEPPVSRPGIVFYEDSATGDGSGFDNRVIQILTDSGLSTDWYVVFTGNVDLLEGVYDPGDSPLSAIRDCLDAEFPGGMANAYTDKQGRFCVHGRGARFDPDAVAAGASPGAWNFTRWYAGTGVYPPDDPTMAQLRPPLTWSRPRNRIINVGYCTPERVNESALEGQYYIEGPSVTKYGRRPWRAENLLVKAGTTTGNTGAEECLAYATYMVTNYAYPKMRVDALTLKSIALNHFNAEATWAMLVGADISDAVNLWHDYPPGGGTNDEFFIEGSEMQMRRLNEDYDMIELSLNVSPTGYYADALGLLG